MPNLNLAEEAEVEVGRRGRVAPKEKGCRLSSASCFVSRSVVFSWAFIESENGLGWKRP